MRQTIWTGLIGCSLTFLTGCGGAAYAKSPEADYGMAGAAAPAGPAPEQRAFEDPNMAGSFKDDALRERDENRVATTAEVPPASQPSSSTAPGAVSSPTTPTRSTSEISAVRAPLLIYTAQITMAVFEVNAALGQLEDLGRELGGFLSRRDDNSITIRVPVALFDTAVKRIEKSGDMLHRNVTAQDVTEEFRDIEVRIRNARAVRDRLEQLLAKATKVDESVVVERELERVAGEIERMEGRIKFLRDRAAFSTITVTFQPKAKEEISQGPFRLPVPWLNELGLSRLLRL